MNIVTSHNDKYLPDITVNNSPGIVRKKNTHTGNDYHQLNFTLPNTYKPVFKPISFTGTNNITTNKRLNIEFDKAFNQNNASVFMDYINNTLKSLSTTSYNTDQWEVNLSQKADGISLLSTNINNNSENNVVNVDLNAHVQVNNSLLGELFISEEELENKCGMHDESKTIIGGGIRFLDPANQSNWNYLPLGREWPPDENSIKALLKVFPDKTNKVIMFDSTDTEVGRAYNVKPRGMIAVDPKDSSVIVAVQQLNNDKKISLAPWAIAPFKVPEGKKVLAVFPVEKPFISKYESALKDKLANKDINNYEVKDIVLYGKNQWQIDKQNNFMFLDPAQEGGMVGALDAQANWSMFAIEDSDKVVVMRSIYRNSHNDQFKAFILNGNAKYIEQELTAPRVKAGEKSTLVFKIDLVPLSSLNVGFDKFTEENFKHQTTEVAKVIRDKITRIRRETKQNLKVS